MSFDDSTFWANRQKIRREIGRAPDDPQRKTYEGNDRALRKLGPGAHRLDVFADAMKDDGVTS